MDWECGDRAAADEALASADVVVKQRLVDQRLIRPPIEPRGAAGAYDARPASTPSG